MSNTTQRTKPAVCPQPHLKAPPYSGLIMSARRSGLAPQRLGWGHIIIVLEWQPKYLRGLPFVVFPPDEDAAIFDWSFCAGLDICIVYTDSQLNVFQRRLNQLVKALFNANIADLTLRNIDREYQGRPGAYLHIIPLCLGHPDWDFYYERG